jgi:glycosyltransferase involved in cell wall biosynthesis
VIRLLTFSTLYPNSVTPTHGIFVETRLRHLIRSGQVDAKVIAPVPWFPTKHRMFKRYARQAQVPQRETLHGIEVWHPRYLLIPKLGMSSAPLTLALAAIPAITRLRRSGFEFDAIDAHYYYPDGVSAAIIARHFRKPLAITARGTDLNLIPKYRIPRKLIQWAARQADYSISVCKALEDELAQLGVEPHRLVVLRNGVDLQRFVPVDRRAARTELGLPDTLTFISIGHLVERKGHDLAIKAVAQLPGSRLLIVGDGELRRPLERLAHEIGMAKRVTFTGNVPQERLKYFLSAADALILASNREGWPNVLLESMACGTPVVATRQWGTPEVVAAPEAGVLVSDRTDQALAKGVTTLLAAYPSREATRAYAERFSWDDTTRGQLRIFSSLAHLSNAESRDSAHARAVQPASKPD